MEDHPEIILRGMPEEKADVTPGSAIGTSGVLGFK